MRYTVRVRPGSRSAEAARALIVLLLDGNWYDCSQVIDEMSLRFELAPKTILNLIYILKRDGVIRTQLRNTRLRLNDQQPEWTQLDI